MKICVAQPAFLSSGADGRGMKMKKRGRRREKEREGDRKRKREDYLRPSIGVIKIGESFCVWRHVPNNFQKLPLYVRLL